MASSLPDIDLLRVKELGKYEDESDSRNEKGRPHEKSRVLAAEDVEVDYTSWCAECGKHMGKVKNRFVCSCKLMVHCSKVCFKSSKHKCANAHDLRGLMEDYKEKVCPDPEKNEWGSYYRDQVDKSTEATIACAQQYSADLSANRSPSSGKIAHFLKISRGDHRQILRYAERRNPTASFIIGYAYVAREFDRQANFAIPLIYKEQSFVETNKIAIKWLKVAAEGGVPEAMFLLFTLLNAGLNPRVAEYWLTEAHATGEMDYLSQLLETPLGPNFPNELDFMYKQIIPGSEPVFQNGLKQTYRIGGETLAKLLVATRFQELKGWGGKTAMGKRFYGWGHFNKLMELIGEVKNVEARPSFIVGEKATLVIIIARPGYLDLVDKTRFAREENNVKFMQGVKDQFGPDSQLVGQTSNVDGRTSYFIACKHSPIDNMELFRINSLEDLIKMYKCAGKCESCVQEARQRLRAVSLGLYSISLSPVFPPGHYAARYANEDGVIVQDVFKGYSKPYMRQTLQCLMINPEDLHPLVVAENAILFWPIIWFWGSVYRAVQDSCDKITLDAIYHGLGHKIAVVKSDNASAMAAFPEAAAGEWRIACGNEDCPKVDHEVKFNLCEGCKVRRYCDSVCQRQDWPKHKQVCKAGKKQPFPRTNLPYNTAVEVQVSHAESPDKMFLRPASGMDKYSEILKNCQNPSGKVKASTGVVCLAYAEEIYQRAEVVEHSSDLSTAKVFLLDNGKTVEVAAKGLKTLDKFLDVPGLVAEAGIVNLGNGGDGWGNDAVEMFKSVVDAGGDTSFMVTNVGTDEGGVVRVKMVDMEGNDMTEISSVREVGVLVDQQLKASK